MSKTLKTISIFMAIVLTMSLFAVSSFAAGDTMATATEIVFGTKYTGTIDKSNTRDYYKIVIPESGALTINTTVFEDMYYALYNEDGGTLVADALSTAYTAGGLKNEVFTTHLTEGTYYFDHHRWGVDGDYQVKFTFESANETIKEGNGGINEKMTYASNISLNKKYYAQLAMNETQDFYKFVLTKATKIKVSVCTESFIYSAIFDEDGQAIRHSGGVRHDVNGGYHEMELDLSAGTYYYNVSKWNAGCGNYTFSIICDSVATKTLSKISIDSMPNKTTYVVGESFDATGLVVKANYSDGTSAVVNSYAISGFDSSTSGTKTITVSYTENGITKNATFNIIVTETDDTISDDCSCSCHKTGISKFIFKIVLFFQKIFGTNKTCACGIAHY